MKKEVKPGKRSSRKFPNRMTARVSPHFLSTFLFRSATPVNRSLPFPFYPYPYRYPYPLKILPLSFLPFIALWRVSSCRFLSLSSFFHPAFRTNVNSPRYFYVPVSYSPDTYRRYSYNSVLLNNSCYLRN